MKYKHVDAFTEKALSGNPCGVFFEADHLSDDQMLAITKEINFSECAFLIKSDRADFGARYFTPCGEIPLAGHPTISLMHALKEDGCITSDKVTLELPAGIITITFRDDLIEMEQCPPTFHKVYDAKEVAPIFGLDPSDIIDPVITVSTGAPMLMVQLKSIDSLRSIKVDYDKYESFHQNGDFFSPHLFVLDQDGTQARNFDRPPAPLEDPFTGSATGCMAAYLFHHKRITEGSFMARQGHFIGRPGQAVVTITKGGVKIGGKAITVIEGQLLENLSR